MGRTGLLLALLLIVSPISSLASLPVAAQDAGRTTLYASAPDVIDRLPDAPAETVAIIGQAPIADGSAVVVVVRNGTDQPVTGVRINIDQRDMSATPTSVATPAGASQGRATGPLTIPPGGIALALVPRDPVLDPDDDPSLIVTIGPDDDTRMDLAIPRAEIADGTLTGIVTATDLDAAFDPEIVAVCVGPEGTVTGGTHATLVPRRIDPFRSIPLRLPLPAGCDAVLAVAMAHR
ncbi:MAG TPA: hypothetical protein VGT61_14780 [Thermomicrobiales bacterium]|jgi:hypothetical protein|nr:hypothetical protein [Thermomicrobiales bacterium]